MNLLQKIKLLLKIKNIVDQDKKEAFAMNGMKPGYKTSEFWLNVMVQVGLVWSSVRGFIPPKYATIAEAVGVAVYTIARTLAKA